MISLLAILRRHRWLAAFLFWQTSVVVFCIHRYFHSLVDQISMNWPSYFASMEGLHLGWTILTVPLFTWLNKKNIDTVWGWIVVSVIFALIHCVLTTGIYGVAMAITPGHFGYPQSEWLPRMQRVLTTTPIISWVICVIVLAAWYGGRVMVRYEEELNRSNQLKSELAQTQLQMLRMQLNPHFLFNAFNTVSMMVRTGHSKKANDMITLLSNLLRNSLMQNEKAYVTLQEEIDFCKQYLEIEAIRFSDRLKITIDIPPDALAFKVPNMILQPLIENAFKHGLVNLLESDALLSINATRNQNNWILNVHNTGLLKKESTDGVGLKNIKERLKLYYGNDAAFNIHQDNGHVSATLSLPI
jgi:two-component system, LytTR family, sensor kinase